MAKKQDDIHDEEDQLPRIKPVKDGAPPNLPALPGLSPDIPAPEVKYRKPKKLDKRLRKSYVQQLEQRDCGVACMAMIMRYHGGAPRLERLRELSGTDRSGTTVLGLFQAGPQVGLVTDGLQADNMDEFRNWLKDNPDPCILNVYKTMPGGQKVLHFYTCFGTVGDDFLIADPDSTIGWRLFSEEELEADWPVKAVLTASPDEGFVRSTDVRRDKFRWIMDLIREDFNVLGIALFLGLAMSVIGMASAVFSQVLIDRILPSREGGLLAFALVLLGFVIVVQAVLGYVRSYFLIGQSRDFNNRIINKFYGSLLHLPKSFFDSRKVGEMVARMNDTARIQGTVQTLFTNIAISILQVIASSIFIFYYSPEIGTVAMFSMPLYFGLMYIFNDTIVKKQRLVMQAYALNEANYVDTIQGIAPIKTGNREGVYSSLTQFIYGHLQTMNFNLGKLGINLGLIGGVVGAILNMVILSWGSYMVLTETLTIGSMMAIVQITATLLPAVQGLASVIIQLQEANVAFDRMYEFAALKPEYEEEEDAKKTTLDDVKEIEVKDLAFRFPGRGHLLKGIHFTVRKGEVISIMGESGCGKSTTLSILQHFYHKESGAINVNGHPWESLSVKGWRQNIGVVPQTIKVFNGTLIDNITMGMSAGGQETDVQSLAAEVEYFAKTWGLDKYFVNFPMGYNTMLGEEGVNISGGQQQIVAIARALYQRPKVLLLDEATSAMDRQTESDMLAQLRSMRDEMIVIFVTHRIKTASKADRIYVIEEGVITANGSHEDLMKTENFYSLSWKDLHA